MNFTAVSFLYMYLIPRMYAERRVQGAGADN